MNKEIIVKKSDWSATLSRFEVGQIEEFTVSSKVAISIRQTASRQKKSTGKIFSTSIINKGIQVTREA